MPIQDIDFYIVVYIRESESIVKNTTSHKPFRADVLLGPKRLTFIDAARGFTPYYTLVDLRKFSSEVAGELKTRRG